MNALYEFNALKREDIWQKRFGVDWVPDRFCHIHFIGLVMDYIR